MRECILDVFLDAFQKIFLKNVIEKFLYIFYLLIYLLVNHGNCKMKFIQTEKKIALKKYSLCLHLTALL